MKPLIFILLLCPFATYSQETYVPDDNFEAFLEANGMGNGVLNDDYVTTDSISGIISLSINYLYITDLTGIEGFTSLQSLNFSYNQVSTVNLSQCPVLHYLYCYNTSLTSLDLSQNSQLQTLLCHHTDLECIILHDNTPLSAFWATDNPNLTCVQVGNPGAFYQTYSGAVDSGVVFSNDCNCYVSIEELSSSPKELIKIIDLMGRETEFKPNTPLIYIYSDGSTKSVMKLEE